MSCFGRSLCPSPCSCLVSLPLWPCVAQRWGPQPLSPLAAAPRAATSTALLFFPSIYLYILFLGGAMASGGFVQSKRFCNSSGTSILHPGSWLGPFICFVLVSYGGLYCPSLCIRCPCLLEHFSIDRGFLLFARSGGLPYVSSCFTRFITNSTLAC